MHLIVGLGNPGKKYERTRHNVGFLVVEELAKQQELAFTRKTSFEAEVAESQALTLMKPQTFMNMSGRSVKSFLAKHKCNASDILVIYDDADIPFGTIKFKQGGSSAGHNGMQSIIDQFPKGTPIARVRVGIGRPIHADIPLDAFVLQTWTAEEEKKLPDLITQTIQLTNEHLKPVA